MQTVQKGTKGISAFPLKVIAIAAMLLNHMGSGLYWNESHYGLYLFTETIGKLTFPIMAFLLVEGFYHTRDQKKYAIRLALFWLLSIVPFYLLFSSYRPFGATDLVNNIFFTLLMGLLLLMLAQYSQGIGRIMLLIGFALLTAVSDWGLIGIFLIWGYDALRGGSRLARATLPTTAVMLAYMALLLASSTVDILSPEEQRQLVHTALTMLGMLGTIPLLLCYNGQRGPNPAVLKWGFYAFYPLHLLALWAIRTFLN